MNKRLRGILVVVCMGLIWAYFAMAQSYTFNSFAPVMTNVDWLYAVAFVGSIFLGLYYSDAKLILYSVVGASLIAALVFSGALAYSAWLLGTRTMDLVLLFAFQQSAPQAMVMSVLGLVGAFITAIVKTNMGLLMDEED